MALGHDQGHILGYAVFAPYLENVLHQLWLGVECAPFDFAWMKGIMLERNERQIRETAMLFQVIDETSHPRCMSLCIWPNPNILIYAFENGPAKFEGRIYFVKGRGPLDVQSAVIFGHRVLAVGLLAHFDVGNTVSALLNVRDFSSRIIRRAIKHGDRNHRRQIIG